MNEDSAQLNQTLKNLTDQISKLQKTVNEQNEKVADLEEKLNTNEDDLTSEPATTNEDEKDIFSHSDVLKETPTLVPTYTPQKTHTKPVINKNSTVPSYKLDTNEVKEITSSTSDNVEMESIIGGKWLVKIGVIAILIGFSFFMKYAFDNWIGAMGQALSGYLFGMGMVGGGLYLRNKNSKYLNYADVLVGGGFGIIYLTSFASYHFLDLINYWTAFIFFLLTTVASSATAIKLNSKYLAYFSVIGGFLTPLLLGNIIEHQKILLFYMIILNFGLIFISIFKGWNLLNIIGVIFTYILLGAWLDDYYTPQNAGTSVIIVSLFSLIYFIPLILNQFVDKIKANYFDLGTLCLNTFFYYTFIYSLIISSKSLHDYDGLFTIICALLFVILTGFAYIYRKEDELLKTFLAGISIFFATLAIPMTFSNQWLTIAFASEAFALIWIGFKAKNYIIRYLGLGIYSISILLFITSEYSFAFYNGDTSSLVKFISVSITVTTICYVTAYFYKKAIKLTELEYEFIKPVTLIASQLLTLYSLVGLTYYGFSQLQEFKISLNTDRTITNQAIKENIMFMRDLFLTILFAIYSYTLFAFASIHKDKILKYTATGIFCLIFIYLFALTSYNTNTLQDFSISIVFALISIIGMGLGIAFKYKNYRLVSMSLLALILFKLFLFDTWSLSEIYRIIAYISLGLLLVGIGFIYVKYQDRIKEALLD